MSEKDVVEKGFKLVGKHNKLGLTSITLPLYSPWLVNYVPGEWVEPVEGCGPLSVFETFNDVLTFIGTYAWGESIKADDVQLWEVEWVKGEGTTLFYPKLHYHKKGYEVVNSYMVRYNPMDPMPPGLTTLTGIGFAAKVKLTKDVSKRYTDTY